MFGISKSLLHVLLIFLMFGSIVGLFTGAALVLRPSWMLYASKLANRWITMRKTSDFLERLIKIDRWFYRYRHVSGMFLMVGATFLIYFFTVRFDKLAVLEGLCKRYSLPSAFIEVLLDSSVLSILLGAAFALIISLFLLIRPSMMRDFEQGANQWISMRQALKPLEVSRVGVDQFVFRNVQMSGVLLLFGSLYTLAMLTIWL